MEELGHRASFDLDFHTRRALQDTRPILAEIEQALPGRFELLQVQGDAGAGFSGLLRLDDGQQVPVQVLSSYEDVPQEDMVASRCVPGLARVSLARYLADKIQCVVERVEARDLFDIHAVLDRHPEFIAAARVGLAEQDALLVAERLSGWTDEGIRDDLRAYADIDPAAAIETRELLLSWLRDQPDSPLPEDQG